MPEQGLVALITQRVMNRLQTEQACSGCALRTCNAGNRACDAASQQQKIPVGISARHAHVTQEHLEILYGAGHQLTVYAPLYQPGAFAAAETLTIVGKRMRAIEAVRILGPVRDYSQVEIAQTEAIRLGLNPPIRDSGALAGAEPITLVGPAGTVYLDEGAICATRHIHMTPAEAAAFGVDENSRLKVHFPGERALTLENVRPKIHESYVLQMHLDTDDANAAGLKGGEAIELAR